MAANLHISISAERITSIGSLNITNSILTSLIVTGLIVGFFILIRSKLSSKTQKIHPLQNLAEFVVESFYDLAQGVTGDHKKTRFFLPFFMSFFFFILFNNWFGLLPGVGTVGFKEVGEKTEHAVLLEQQFTVPVAEVQASTPVEETVAEENQITATEEHAVESEEITEKTEEHNSVFVPYLRAGTADLNTTIALGLVSQVMAQLIGVRYLGLAYFKKFFNFKDPIMAFVGLLEMVSEFSKVISYAFRLFGNIFAGEVLLVVMTFLVPLVVPMPFYGLEIFVGFIQALVFSLLTLVFFNIATLSHDEH